MKRLFAFCLLTATLLMAGPASAEPKAYEEVKFTAHSGTQTFLLNYADGYEAGSDIRILEKGQKPIRLSPDTAPDKNQQIFNDTRGKNTLILTKFDCNTDDICTLPTSIPATYSAAGKTLKLTFKQK